MGVKDWFSNYSDKLNDWRNTAAKAADYSGIQSEGMKYANDLARGSLQQTMSSENDGTYGRTAEMKMSPLTQSAGKTLAGNDGYDFVNAKRQAAKDIAGKKVAEEAEKAKTAQSFIGDVAELAGQGIKTFAQIKSGMAGAKLDNPAKAEGYDNYNAMIEDKYAGDESVATKAANGRGFKTYAQAAERAHQHGYANAEEMFKAFDRFGLVNRG